MVLGCVVVDVGFGFFWFVFLVEYCRVGGVCFRGIDD